MKESVRGAIIRDGKMLLIHRINGGREYFVFPGGKRDEGESLEEVLRRELREETSLEIAVPEFLFDVADEERNEHFFLVSVFSGTPAIIGEELGRMSPTNVYELVWMPLAEALAKENLFPAAAREKLAERYL